MSRRRCDRHRERNTDCAPSAVACPYETAERQSHRGTACLHCCRNLGAEEFALGPPQPHARKSRRGPAETSISIEPSGWVGLEKSRRNQFASPRTEYGGESSCPMFS